MTRALVLGGAACVYDDEREAFELMHSLGLTFDYVIAANQIGITWPHITDWVTLHCELFWQWQDRRKSLGLNQDYTAVSITKTVKRTKPRVDVVQKDWGGSSGLYAVRRAIELGADQIICCGVPMTKTPHFNKTQAWQDVDSFTNAWKRWKKTYGEQTRSMSGWTKSLLGSPDATFLIGAEPAMRETLEDGDAVAGRS